MKIALPVVAALLASAMAFPASASQGADPEADRYRAAMQSARWTGPMLASNAETLPKGRGYTEPYFFDVISGGKHHPGTSGYYQYGLLDDFTIGVQPNIAVGTHRANRGVALGDFKLLSQLRLTRFTPEHRIPSIAVVLNAALPTGKHDRLGPLKVGHGAGSFAPEIGINVQHIFLLRNDRLMRARFNVLRTFPLDADVRGRSVYGTIKGFRGQVDAGSRTTLIGAVEYSLTRDWVLAFDVIRESTTKTKIRGRDANGLTVNETIPSSHHVGFAPAIEYNWSDRSGILLGVWINPKGHNTPSSVIPALAYSRFW